MTHGWLMALALAGAAPEPDGLPQGPPPQVVAIRGGEETFGLPVTKVIPYTVAVKVVVVEGGKTVYRDVCETRVKEVTGDRETYLVKGTRGRTADGKTL